jgi:hypothetical protein
MSEYRLTLGSQSIAWGTRINTDELFGETAVDSIIQLQGNSEWEWDLPNGVYRAKEIVRELSALLGAILVQLGEAVDSEVFLDNIQASLAISGRESVLPLGSLSFGDKARIELTGQVQIVGETLARWAREFDLQEWALKHYGKSVLGSLILRSRCDQHLWTPKAAKALSGPAGGPAVMQLFNEYLHQLVLLRDALVPFDNWEEVPIDLRERGNAKGLRFLEQARTEFLSEFLVKKMSHKALVRFAQSVLSPGLSTVGYGFQYRLGSILPASLGGSVATAPRYLLHWYPVWTVVADSSNKPTTVSFDYAFHDYYSEPRSHAGSGLPALLDTPDKEPQDIYEAKLSVAGSESDRVILQYQLRIDSVDYAVDLGQALRGHRFMYRPKPFSGSDTELSQEEHSDINEHQAGGILGLPGLITNESGIHFICAGGNPLVLWALLGKLYPENVIVLDRGDAEEIGATRSSGKGFGAKFLIH